MSELLRQIVLVVVFVSVVSAEAQPWTSSKSINRRHSTNSFTYWPDFDDAHSRREFWPEHQYRRPKPVSPTPSHRNGFRSRAPLTPMGRNHPPPFWPSRPPKRPVHPAPVVPPVRHRTNNKQPGYWNHPGGGRIPGAQRGTKRAPAGGSARSPVRLSDNIDIHVNILDQVTPRPPAVKPKLPPSIPAAVATTEKVKAAHSGAEEKSVVLYADQAIPELTADNALSSNYVIRKSDYYGAPAASHYPPSVDFSSLFVALIPIALFLGATSALALATVTKPNQAVATAQQQQQQQEDNNNNSNNDNNNNNLMSSLLASFLASSTYNNNNYNNYPYIIVVNNTAFTIGRSSDQWQVNLRNPFRLFDKLED